MSKSHLFLRWTVLAAAVSMLAACGSSVKLDDGAPVESRSPSAAGSGTAGSGSAAPAAPGGAASQSQVTGVDLTKTTPVATAAAGRVVYFDFDSFVVKDEYRGLINTHARALASTKSRRMLVEGHADERGGREYNLALGQKRAEAVAKALMLLGAAQDQVEAVSFGEERPADEGHDEAAWAKNRRAELKDR